MLPLPTRIAEPASKHGSHAITVLGYFFAVYCRICMQHGMHLMRILYPPNFPYLLYFSS